MRWRPLGRVTGSYFAGEVKTTKRYRLHQLLSRLMRHFLLLMATPHNGKGENFQLITAMLDSDRFDGRFCDGMYAVATSDPMHRLVKEQPLTFEGNPLVPGEPNAWHDGCGKNNP